MLLGRLFDTLGRRPMITFTYAISGLLLAASGYLFMRGVLTAGTQTLAWMVIFFFASATKSWNPFSLMTEMYPQIVQIHKQTRNPKLEPSMNNLNSNCSSAATVSNIRTSNS